MILQIYTGGSKNNPCNELKDLIVDGASETNNKHEEFLKNNPGFDVNCYDNNFKWTPLHYFCKKVENYNETDTIYLVEHGANVNQADKYGNTPLIYSLAVMKNENSNYNMAKYLIEHGANVENSAVDKSFELGDAKIIHLLLDNSKRSAIDNLNSIVDNVYLNVPLDIVSIRFRTSESPLVKTLEKISNAEGDKLKFLKDLFILMLGWEESDAAFEKDEARLRELAKDDDIIKKINEKKLSCNKLNYIGDKHAHITNAKHKEYLENNPGVDINCVDEFFLYAPLHYFCLYVTIFNENDVIYLVERGANINQSSRNKNTPLAIAVGHIKKEDSAYHMAKYLIKHGAEVDVVNEYNITPIMLSLDVGKENLINLLLDNSKLLDVTKKENHITPLNYMVMTPTINAPISVAKRFAKLIDIRDHIENNSPLVNALHSMSRIIYDKDVKIKFLKEIFIEMLSWKESDAVFKEDEAKLRELAKDDDDIIKKINEKAASLNGT